MPRTRRPTHQDGSPDRRYTVTREHAGRARLSHVARFADRFISAHDTATEAWTAACEHARARLASLGLTIAA